MMCWMASPAVGDGIVIVIDNKDFEYCAWEVCCIYNTAELDLNNNHPSPASQRPFSRIVVDCR
jgi:hypothetical protein